jgi:peptidoglycan/xylan/chitin deacetylase (PgdA/CDA1 family)
VTKAGVPVLRRRLLLVVAVIIGLVFAAVTAVWQVSRAKCFALTSAVTCRVETMTPAVALTFDDGPTQLGLDRILPVLERHGAHATFFLIGDVAAGDPQLVRAIVSAGHEVGNHSFTHQRMVARPMKFYREEIARTQSVLRDGGASPRTFRPPYGKKLFGLPLAAKAAGLRMVLWDVEDPTTTDPAAFASEVVAAARPGSIILIHPMNQPNEPARKALPAILAGLKAKGLAVVTVQELLDRAEKEKSPRNSVR